MDAPSVASITLTRETAVAVLSLVDEIQLRHRPERALCLARVRHTMGFAVSNPQTGLRFGNAKEFGKSSLGP